METDTFADLVLPRFLRYVKIHTTSDSHAEQTPSTAGQWELAKLLAAELEALGIKAEVTGHCYALALLPASPGCEGKPVIGFLAHLDTAQDVSGKDVNPVLEKDGEGGTVIKTDGTTLLGADDKAGIAEIMAAAEYLSAHPEIKHGPLLIIFSPDEETGKGLPFFPAERIAALAGVSGITGIAACYTLDGGPAGEFEAECFNAIKADVTFTGRVIHLGHSRGKPDGEGKLANAALMAATFAVMLPRSESPESTDGYYGYYCPLEISGNLEKAVMEIFIRDFDLARAAERAAALDIFAKAVEAQFPGGKVSVKVKSQYFNMKQKIDERPEVLAKLEEAASRCGIPFTLKPIRGGTDGSRLTELGIPTPNIFAGGRNFHSVTEWVPLKDMAGAARLAVELAKLWAE
jgi:tripeptide aminopeptidase